MLQTIFIFNKSKRYQRSDIKDNGQGYQLVHCYDISKASFSFRYQLKRLCDFLSWSVSLRYQLVYRYDVSNWSRFFDVPVRRRKNVSNRSVLLTYRLRRRDDVSAWSRTLKLVPKMDQFLLGIKTVHFSRTCGGLASLRYQLVRRYNISKTSVSSRY